jgi:hypothetical protein
LNDDRLDKEYYTRTSEQDEELGIKDMIVENYSTEGKMISIKEDNELDTN